METRFNLKEIAPEAYRAMLMLEGYLDHISIPKPLLELIKIRASYINSCAFCIDMHTKEALESGEKVQRIFLITSWKEAGDVFTEKEKIAFLMTEEMTLIHEKGLSDETYIKARQFFNEKEVAEILMAVITINAWNRIAISTNLPIVINN